MVGTYIVKFTSVEARDRFVEAVRASPELESVEVVVGEFLPDVILRGVSSPFLVDLKALAPEARFLEDVSHHPITG
jgi:hypothetical protein